MKVEIQSIKNQGDFDKEYVTLKVVEDCDLKYYMIADSTYTSENSISNKLRHSYWFAPKKAKKGDFVWLYTRAKKSGDKVSWATESKTTTHVYYWGLKTAVWNDEGDCAVLFEIKGWNTKKVE